MIAAVFFFLAVVLAIALLINTVIFFKRELRSVRMMENFEIPTFEDKLQFWKLNRERMLIVTLIVFFEACGLLAWVIS